MSGPGDVGVNAVRDLVVASGPEAVSYIHSQVSQDVDDMVVGESRWSFVLQPQGKVDAFFRITRVADDELWLDVDAGFGDVLRGSLERFKLRTKVDFDVGTAVVAIVDGVPAPPAEVTDTVGADDDWEAQRIRSGLPRMGVDIVDSTIPNETDLVDIAVSFTKGCYRGQELVERIHARGGRRQLLRRLVGPEAFDVGATVFVDGDEVGEITSAAGADGTWYGLAYLRGSVEPGSEVQVGTVDASVTAEVSGLF